MQKLYAPTPTDAAHLDLFPTPVVLEAIPIDGFTSLENFFGRILWEISKPSQSFITYLNVHGANMAFENPAWKATVQSADVIYADGAGIVWGSKLLGTPLPCRWTAADWIMTLLGFLATHNRKVYFLGGEPDVNRNALLHFSQAFPENPVIGGHHGYILGDSKLEAAVIAEINALKPDLLFVGMGMPHQEDWVARHRDQLNVPAIWTIGATLDYVARKVPRCPGWMGHHGLEWLFRFFIEPHRMFKRYIIGNPAYISRIVAQRIAQKLQDCLPLVTHYRPQ